MMDIMQKRRALAATFLPAKAEAVARGDYAHLRTLMELTDDILSGHHDVPAEIAAMTDDELLTELQS